MRSISLLLLLTSLSAMADSAELFKVKFQVNRMYRDQDTYCFGSTGKGQAFVSGVIQNGKVVSAKLENFEFVEPYKPIYRAMALSAEEMESLSFYRDGKGRLWITRLELAEPSLKWVAYESAERYSFCPLPQRIETISPATFSFTFETEGLEIGIWLSESDLASIEGTRRDGSPFSGSLQFTQKLWFN